MSGRRVNGGLTIASRSAGAPTWETDVQSLFGEPYPLRPFVGGAASEVDLTTPDAWRYTTIGDMARDSRALGYDYAAPSAPDARPASPDAVAAGHLYILFPGVRCIRETFVVDVFLDLPRPTPADVAGPHHAGRMTRLGMGVEDDKGRCVSRGVTRVMDASRTARALGLASGSPVTVSLPITHAHSGQHVSAEDVHTLPGFIPTARWGDPMPAAPPEARSPSCH